MTFTETRWKLVRDKIPQFAGPDAVYKTESPKIFEEALRLKLIEEAEEAARALTRDALIEEMVDVMEVMSAIGRVHKISSAELNERSKKKRDERGAFTKAVFLLVRVAPKEMPSLSPEEQKQLAELEQEVANLKCSVCGEKQFATISGATCPNNHGGAPGVPIE